MNTEERFERMERILAIVVDNQHQFDATRTLAESHIQTQQELRTLAASQAKTETQIKALGLAMEALERQWQAYINTLRPQ